MDFKNFKLSEVVTNTSKITGGGYGQQNCTLDRTYEWKSFFGFQYQCYVGGDLGLDY